MKRPSKIFNPMFKTQTLKAAELENKAADYRRLKSTPVNSPELISDSEGEEADTPGIYGEGKEEAGAEPKQFNQVMLQAQNRMILIAVLSDQKDKICEKILTELRKSRAPKIEKTQLLVVITAVATFARSEKGGFGLESVLGQLSRDCFHDHQLREDVEQCCKTLLPAAVTAANKRHGTAPHCVFAIDDIVHKAVHSILVIVSPDSVQSVSEKAPPTPTKTLSQTSLVTSTPMTTPTSSVDAKDVARQLRAALEENLQLLRDMNDVMRAYVLEVKGQAVQPAPKKKVTFLTDSLEGVDSGVAMGDSELVAWLEEIQLDPTSIQRFVAEQLTLSDVQDHMTRDDVIDLKLKIGQRCRVWAAITEHRSKQNT
jgi:hypothetical protein